MQCYVQQLRQLRQDAKQLEPATPAPAFTQQRQSGEVAWTVLSPASGPHQLTATLALHLGRAGSGPPALATTQVTQLPKSGILD